MPKKENMYQALEQQRIIQLLLQLKKISSFVQKDVLNLNASSPENPFGQIPSKAEDI
jgi:hypothetical protein